MRGERLIRQWKLLKILVRLRYGATMQDLCTELEVGRRTVQRDLDVLREVGFPLTYRTGPHGAKRWFLDPDREAVPNLTFNITEAIALYLGRQMLAPLGKTDLGQAAEAAFRKIRRLLDKPALEYFARLPSLVYVKPPRLSNGAQGGDVWDALTVGVEDGQVVRITYQTAQPKAPYTAEVHPYGLVYHEAGWYLIALDPARDGIRHYKVDRVLAAEVTKRSFTRPAGFSLKDHLAKSFGIFQPEAEVRAVVRVRPPLAATAAEARWHPSQQVERHPDGSVTLSFRLGGTEELKRWVQSFGPHAEVLEPAALRQEMAEELRAAADQYDDGEPRTIPLEQR